MLDDNHNKFNSKSCAVLTKLREHRIFQLKLKASTRIKFCNKFSRIAQKLVIYSIFINYLPDESVEIVDFCDQQTHKISMKIELNFQFLFLFTDVLRTGEEKGAATSNSSCQDYRCYCEVSIIAFEIGAMEKSPNRNSTKENWTMLRQSCKFSRLFLHQTDWISFHLSNLV